MYLVIFDPFLKLNFVAAILDHSELTTSDCDILNPNWLINLKMNNKRRTSII